MAKFNYRMQNILQLKEKMEEQERNNFAARRRALTEEEDKLRALIDKRNAVAEEGKWLRQTVIDVRSIRENEDLQRYTEEQVKQQRIRLRWEGDTDEDAFWQMEMEKSDITNDYILIVTDYADEADIDSLIDIWDSNLERLHRKTGI